MPEMIDTSVMPGDTMDPDAIDGAAAKLRSVGSSVSAQGGTVLASWQKISASYDAPEEQTLFQAMNPVKTAAEKFGTDTGSAATALEAFAEEVRTIKAAVAQIRKEAAAFKAEAADGIEVTSYNWKTGSSGHTKDWHEDQASVDKNNELISRTNDQQEALWKAERTCANAIRALVGLGPLSAATESNPNGYGVDEIPDGTDMPWGAKVERTEDCGEGIVHGAVNGLSGLVGGVTSLVGLRNSGEGLWGWDWNWDWSLGNAGETWAGLGKFAVGAATFGPGGIFLASRIPGPVGDFLRDSQKTFVGGVAGLVAIDVYAEDPLHNWKEHGWRALGESAFNVATIVVPATKAGDLGNLGKVGRAGEVVMNVTDPLYLATKAAEGLKTLAGPTVESLVRLERAIDLDTSMSVTNKTDIEIPAVRTEHISPDLPNSTAPDVDVPPARDYVEPMDRYGHHEAPEQSPAAAPDREPAVVGGRGSEVDSGTSSHPEGESSASSSGSSGHDASDAGGPGGRDASESPSQPENPAGQPGAGDDVGDQPGAGGQVGDQPGAGDQVGDQSPAGDHHETVESPAATGSTATGPDLPPGLAHRSFEDTTHGYGPETHAIDDTHPKVDFGRNPNSLGEYGERLTRTDLEDRGYTIVSEQAQIRLPGQPGKFFKPDFIAVDPQGNIVLVESKMGQGAKFTPNQLVGYEQYAKGVDDLVGRTPRTNFELQQALRDAGVGGPVKVSKVEVYRWNTEIVPSPALRSRAGVP